MNNELGPLPEPDYPAGGVGTLGQNCYTADQMRTYAAAQVAAAVAAEREKLRAAQAEAVMPLIGPLLDAWECCSQAVREEHPELDKQLRQINRAMEDAGDEPNVKGDQQ